MDNETVQKADTIIEKNEKISVFTKIGNGIKSGANKVKDFASKHPVATFITGTVIGSAATIGTAAIVNHALQKGEADDDYEDADILDDDDIDASVDVDDINVDV